MAELPVRGVIGPMFIGLAVVFGTMGLKFDTPLMHHLTALFVVLALVFARDTARLFKATDA